MTFPVDDPPVAAMPSGGPVISPDLLIGPGKYHYEVVRGFFLQNGPKPKSMKFEHLLNQSFGLIDSSPERWHNLKSSIEQLQRDAPEDVQYKVFFLGRHGEGMHNYAVLQVGVEPWDDYWAFQTTNGTLTWGPDPPLSETGFAQAKAICECWHEQAPLGAPITGEEMKWFVSPLTRTGQTLLHSWGDLLAGRPEIWEDFREIFGSHTCDRRSPKRVIKERFPDFSIEDGFVEEDELWKPDERESEEHMQIRAQRSMDRIFGEQGVKETYVSITGHSGIFRNLLAVLGHQAYPLETGEMIPIVVRATRLWEVKR